MEFLARTCKTEQMNFQRILARVMLVLGGAFWISMVWGAQWAYQGAPLTEAIAYSLPFAGAIVLVFVVGLFYEYVAAALLAVAAVGVVVLGIVVGWEAGVWGTMAFVVIIPMLISAAFYAAAARMQAICTLSV